jgi:hypothetical protein
MTINRDNLPRPSVWEVIASGPERIVTNEPGAMLISVVLDASLEPQRLRLGWTQVRREVVSAIHRHYSAHWSAVFKLTDPRSAEQLDARWMDAPSISWINGVTATVTAEFEVAVAHE